MGNPFQDRQVPFGGPSADLVPVVASNDTDLPDVALALYIETGGTLCFTSAAGEDRVVVVPDFHTMACGVQRVLVSSGVSTTSASGIHAYVSKS